MGKSLSARPQSHTNTEDSNPQAMPGHLLGGVVPRGMIGLCFTYGPTRDSTRLKNQKICRVWWCVPSIPTLQRLADLCEFPGQPGHREATRHGDSLRGEDKNSAGWETLWNFQTDSARQSWDGGFEVQMRIWGPEQFRGVIHLPTKALAPCLLCPFFSGTPATASTLSP